MIGNATTPLKVQPSIYLNNITNLVYNSTTENDTVDDAADEPSVQFVINGVVRNFDIISTGQGAIHQGYQVYFPPVGTTGRTAVQATAIDNLKVAGSAKNLTLSRAPVPFSSENSGLNYLKKATFGGNADGVGIDVKGKIGTLTFKRGLGNPNGVFTSKSSTGLLLPTTTYGTPTSVDRLSRRRRSGRPDPCQEHRQAQRQGGQRQRADAAGPQLRSARRAGLSDLRFEHRHRPHQRGDHDLGVDRPGQYRRDPRSTPRSRPASTSRRIWPAWKGRVPRARSAALRIERGPDQFDRFGERPPATITTTTRRRRPSVPARST